MHIYIHTDRQAGGQAVRQTDSQMYRQTYKKTYIHKRHSDYRSAYA